jgi:hypothetical protein
VGDAPRAAGPVDPHCGLREHDSLTRADRGRLPGGDPDMVGNDSREKVAPGSRGRDNNVPGVAGRASIPPGSRINSPGRERIVKTSFVRSARHLSVIFVAVMGIQCSPVGDEEQISSTQLALTSAEIDFCNASGLNVIVGTAGNDTLTGTAGADCIVGLGGQDTINAGGGDDIVFGGDGDDVIVAGAGNDRVFGGAGQDTLFGGDGNDTLMGGDGDDRLFGEAGDDVLNGEQGQDRLSGGVGNDNLTGGPGDDTLSGDAGNDVLNDCSNHNRFDGGAGTNSCQGDTAASTFASCAVVTRCTAQLDQSFTTPTNLGAAINEGFRFIGQTYTAGVTGTLQSIAIDVQSTTTFVLRVTVRGVTGGLPNGTILGQARAPRSGSIGLGDVISFSAPIQQVAGQRYAIVVDYPEAPPPPNNQGTWQGATGNVYPSGGLVFSADGVSWLSNESDGFDLHFQTFVVAN